MLEVQNNYLNYLKLIQDELAGVGIENNEIAGLAEVIAGTELIVPVMGPFSAGKSSMINSFLGQDRLPVGIPPETALAAELRYSERDYIKAVMANDVCEEYGIDEMDRINEKADQYTYLCIYLNNVRLQSIAPIVLVDMPGLDSPLDIHNRAIVNYFNRGVYYIVMTGVEDGILTRSTIRHLSDIREIGKDFSIFVSKANLKAPSEVNEVAEKIREQIEGTFNLSKDVIPVGKDGGNDLKNIITQLKPETLFENLFIPALKNNFHSIIGDLNIRISALRKDDNENKEAMEELQARIDSMTRKQREMIEDAKEKYSSSSVDRIVDAVGKDLSQSVDELTNRALSGGVEALSRDMVEILRSSLIVHIKASASEISQGIIDDFSHELNGREKTLSSFFVDDNILEKLTENIQNRCRGSFGKIKEILGTGKSGNTDLYRTITSILAVTTTILAPVLEVIIILLPNILSKFIGEIQKKKQVEQLKNNLLTVVIPGVKRKLRQRLPDIFDSQLNSLITQIGDRFNDMLREHLQAIAAMQEKKHMDEITETVNSYTAVMEKISSHAGTTLY